MNSNLIVREATAADAAALAHLNSVVQRLHFEAYPDRFHEPNESEALPYYEHRLGGARGGSGPERAWICRDESDEAIGYVLGVLRERPDNPFTKAIQWIELDQIAVVDGARGHGAGRLLASEVLDWARDVDVHLIELSVWSSNQRAQDFFHAMGFEPLWHRRSLNIRHRR